MMTIEEMRERKEELMYTYEMIAEKSKLPISTVQKVLGGITAKPRLETMRALDHVLKDSHYHYGDGTESGECLVNEEALDYLPDSGDKKITLHKTDRWFGLESSERWPRQGEYTVKDYLEIPDDIRVELIDGVIYDMGAPSRKHQSVLSHLFAMFYNCIEEHESECEVLFAPFDVRLDCDDRTMVQPDLLIVCPGDRPKNKYTKEDEGKRLNGAPDLAAEVLSPSTKEKDCTIKLRKYMNAGVKEYWIIDVENEKVMVYMFEKDYLPTQYSFDDVIPVGISNGVCDIDFRRIKEKIKRYI